MGSVVTMDAGISGSSAWVLGAQVDVTQNGVLEGFCVSVNADLDADADKVAWNLTFSSTPGAPSNDARSSIATETLQHQLVTSGSAVVGTLKYCKLPDIPVAAGERLFLHMYATTGVTAETYLGLHFSFNQPVPSSRR